MFAVNDKRRLYWLIDQYIQKKINAEVFEDEYYKSYCLEVDSNSLTDKEKQVEQDIKLLLQVGFFYGTKSDYPLETYCRNDGVWKKECCRILLTELCNNLKTEIMKNRVQCESVNYFV